MQIPVKDSTHYGDVYYVCVTSDFRIIVIMVNRHEGCRTFEIKTFFKHYQDIHRICILPFEVLFKVIVILS